MLERLYKMTARDLQTAPLIQLAQKKVRQVASAGFNIAYQVPLGSLDLINLIQITVTPGSGQNYVSILAQIFDETFNLTLADILVINTAGGANVNFQQTLLLPSPGLPINSLENFQVGATFNSGVGINTIAVSILGLRIPKGNFATGNTPPGLA